MLSDEGRRRLRKRDAETDRAFANFEHDWILKKRGVVVVEDEREETIGRL